MFYGVHLTDQVHSHPQNARIGRERATNVAGIADPRAQLPRTYKYLAVPCAQRADGLLATLDQPTPPQQLRLVDVCYHAALDPDMADHLAAGTTVRGDRIDVVCIAAGRVSADNRAHSTAARPGAQRGSAGCVLGPSRETGSVASTQGRGGVDGGGGAAAAGTADGASGEPCRWGIGGGEGAAGTGGSRRWDVCGFCGGIGKGGQRGEAKLEHGDGLGGRFMIIFTLLLYTYYIIIVCTLYSA